MKKIGLFGGTFDPLHHGHINIAKCFVEKCELELCYFIPTKISPFKQNNVNMLTDKERLAQFDIISNDKQFIVSDYEINKNTISYTFNTVKYFRNLYPNYELFMLIGTDQAIQFYKWNNYKYILKNTKIVIATRPEPITLADKTKINEIFQHKCIWLNNVIISVTGTELRKSLLKNNF